LGILKPWPEPQLHQSGSISRNRLQIRDEESKSMLMLLFQAGNRRYALNSQIVGEVLPWASLYPATGSHSAIAGLL
jgi:chemotaxis signal transduction protein